VQLNRGAAVNEVATANKHSDDLDSFVGALGDVPVERDPKTLQKKSRDFFWYSPVLKRELQGKLADIVVVPRDEADVVRVAGAAARYRVPITIRGGGTGNYGQCVPVQGGVVLDMSNLRAIEWQKGALVRVGSGCKMHLIDAETRKQGYEQRMHPSTKRMASIGGFAAGGSAGAGSVTYGGLRELGNIAGARVISLEENPRAFELKGDAALKICHGWGTTGIVTALEMPLAPAFDWVDLIVAFDDFMAAVRFGYELALADGVVKKLVTPLGWPIPSYFSGMEQYFPMGRAAVIAMVAHHSIEPFKSLAGTHNGTITYQRPTDESMGARPLYEFTWGHTTLHAINADGDITYLQALYPAFGFMEKVAEIDRLFPPDEFLRHLEFTRYAGQVTAYGLDLIKYTTDERLNEIMETHRRHDVFIADPHIWMLEDSAGYKSADADLMGFKREVDPLGICNPGKMRTYIPLR
jgi:FAD/FMN-containing dehydrogenase